MVSDSNSARDPVGVVMVVMLLAGLRTARASLAGSPLCRTSVRSHDRRVHHDDH
jgi:hypothetical protein